MDKNKLADAIETLKRKRDGANVWRENYKTDDYEQKTVDLYSIDIEHLDIAIMAMEQAKWWTSVDVELPKEKGKYLVTYHPCYWDVVREQVLVGTDTFRGKNVWAKYKYQRNTHWMEIPEAATEETKQT